MNPYRVDHISDDASVWLHISVRFVTKPSPLGGSGINGRPVILLVVTNVDNYVGDLVPVSLLALVRWSNIDTAMRKNAPKEKRQPIREMR